jgi:hypothetical protein
MIEPCEKGTSKKDEKKETERTQNKKNVCLGKIVEFLALMLRMQNKGIL